MGKIAYRRVAPDWEHPKSDRDGSSFKPLLDGAQLAVDITEDNTAALEFYMPRWTPGQATAWQVYEEVTEGTPISEVYPDLDTVARKIAAEYGHGFEAMRNKILATLEHGWYYVPVKEFEFGGKYYGMKFKEV